ncbi:MAG: hypothetical protein QNK33_07795, partial [Bacteroidales bacterium]|nr:hypothetical protein [Bacteroidales bacterium]
MRKNLFTLLLLAALSLTLSAQNGLKYQKPPKEIVEILNASPTPGVSISPDKKLIALTQSPGMPTIEDISREMLRIGGLRIDPQINGSSTRRYSIELKFMDLNGNNQGTIKGMPEGLKLGSFSWSKDSKEFAFINFSDESIELWVGDVATMS